MWKTTGKSTNTARLPVDAQPTSFEENKEFYLTHFFNAIPALATAMLRATIGPNDVILFDRTMALNGGVIKYRAYPLGFGEIITGTFTDVTANIRPTNYILDDSGLQSHGSPSVTWEACSSGSFTPGSAAPVGVPGSIAATSNGSNQQSAYSSSGLKLGYTAGLEFVLVFENTSNEPANLEFFMAWEVR